MSAILAIDTASADFALALAVDGEIRDAFARPALQDHSKLLLGAIDQMLGELRTVLGGIVAVRGPGSYAGLRVGIATAEGLALARGIPIVGVATLEAVAAAAGAGRHTVIHPAGRGEFAAQDAIEGALEGEPRIATPAELAGLALAGEGAGAFGGREVTSEARCRAALQLGAPLIAAGASGGIEAFYLREPSITRPKRPLRAS